MRIPRFGSLHISQVQPGAIIHFPGVRPQIGDRYYVVNEVTSKPYLDYDLGPNVRPHCRTLRRMLDVVVDVLDATGRRIKENHATRLGFDPGVEMNRSISVPKWLLERPFAQR